MSEEKKNSCSGVEEESCCSGCPSTWSGATWGYLILRGYLGITFFLAGLAKFTSGESDSWVLSFQYYQENAGGMVQHFLEKSPLHSWALYPYTYLLPFIEILLGLGILLGIKSKCCLALTGLTFVSLTFGLKLVGNSQAAGDMGIYCLLAVAALMLVQHNKLECFK